MGLLIEQLEKSLPKGMYIPEPLKLLYEWIESKGYYQDYMHQRTGYLFPLSEIVTNQNENEMDGGTFIEF